MADATALDVPADPAQIAEEKGVRLALVRGGLALGFAGDVIRGQLGLLGATAEAAEEFISEKERIRAGGEITIPEELLEVAQKHEWPESLVKRALALGGAPDFVAKQIEAGIKPDQAERFIAQQEAAREGGLAQTLDLSWMKVPTEWGIRVRPGNRGLTVEMLNVGTYADVPDHWPYQTEMPRGAYPIPGVAPMGYTIYEKAELWADNAADLYEDAIQRRWRPATDIPWTTMEPLPDEIERAVGQLCTHFCERVLLSGDIIGSWPAGKP